MYSSFLCVLPPFTILTFVAALILVISHGRVVRSVLVVSFVFVVGADRVTTSVDPAVLIS